jgi:ATP-dependent DNA helicase RecG
MTNLSKHDLLEIIRNGENSVVEFKRDDITHDKLAKELVAFSNFEGGMVILGVEDDGKISGITRHKLEEWVVTTCRDKIDPAIIPFFEIIKNVENNKDVAIVRVAPGYTVHSFKDNQRNLYLIRVGTQCREASKDELSRLFQQRGMFRSELQPVSGATFDDLDPRRLKHYFLNIRQQPVPDDNDEAAWKTLLFNTELMIEEGVTVAALLLFGFNPNRFLPQAGIDATAFVGKEKDYAARERVEIRGPITPLHTEKGLLVEPGLVEQTLAFITRNMVITAGLEPGGARRETRTEYPLEALREILVNALIHRDYLLASTDIELCIYQDRLELISPGRLPNGITPQRMLAGCRASRNQLIKDVMRDYRYLEHSGMGIPRKVVAGMQAHNGTLPDLIEQGESFKVVLHSKAIS